MKRRKLSFIIFLLQVCNIELSISKSHHGNSRKSKRSHGFYGSMLETNKYIGKSNLFNLEGDFVHAVDGSSQTGSCPNCNRTHNDHRPEKHEKNLYHREDSESGNNFMNKSELKEESKRVDKHHLTHQRLNEKVGVLSKMTEGLSSKDYPNGGPYGPPNPGYGPPTQDPYSVSNQNYSPVGQVPNYGPADQGSYGAAPPDAGYQAAPPSSYGPPTGQAPDSGYTPEQYPDSGSLPPQGGQDYYKPGAPPGYGPGYDNGYMGPGMDQNGYADQDPMSQSSFPNGPGYDPGYGGGYGSGRLDDEDESDVHNSFKCRFLAFFFPECKDKGKYDPRRQYQYPMAPPVSQQYCNIYGSSDLNLSDFNSTGTDWLLVNQNNSLRITRNKPVESDLQTLDLKNNYCNKEDLSCTLQLGENSTAGLSVRGRDRQRLLVELNSLTKTVSLKQVNPGSTQVLLETPFPKLSSNFLHLVQVKDGGFQGTFSVTIDGEKVFSRSDLPTQTTGLMGLFISSGNATFGNLSVTPVSS